VLVFDSNVLTGLRAVAIVDGQISTGFVESAINGEETTEGGGAGAAHFLLQIRTRVLDEERENTFGTWYPISALKDKPKKAA
jgi:hypothetical protein